MVVVRPCWRKSRGRSGVDSYPEDQPPSKTSSFSAGYIQTYTNHSPVPRNKFFLVVKYGWATNQEYCQGGTSRINLSILVKVHSLPGIWRCKIIWGLVDQLLPGTTWSLPKKKIAIYPINRTSTLKYLTMWILFWSLILGQPSICVPMYDVCDMLPCVHCVLNAFCSVMHDPWCLLPVLPCPLRSVWLLSIICGLYDGFLLCL